MIKTSKNAYSESIDLDAPCNSLFVNVDPIVTRDDAKHRGIPLFDGKQCKCGNKKRINIHSPQWSSKGNHDGECYVCYQAGSLRRQSAVKKYLKRYPDEIQLLKQLVKIRLDLDESTGLKHHIHHKIPVGLKNNYPDSEHNESASNKIVVTHAEHVEIHNNIRADIHPHDALDMVVSDQTGRIV